LLEEDLTEITVHLVQLEKDVPFCMPGAEDTIGKAFARLRKGGRTIVTTPFDWGGVVCVHYGGRWALGNCAVGVVSWGYTSDGCWRRSGRG